MEIFFVVVLFALLFAQWWVTGKRLDELEQDFARWKPDSVSVRELAEVIRRVQALEHPVAAAPQRQEPPVRPAQVVAPVVITAAPPAFASYVHVVAPATLAVRLRSLIGDQEWEALVGGSLLNKLGALILVIGIALFLSYSFAHVTAAGRASIALAVSAGILCAGVWTDRRPRFKVFARGLIGAGWAALYATSYAIYAVPAARVIDNPYLGSAGMLLVGIGMIAHALRYRIQTVTAVAYFSAFAALAVTPSGPFAVLSLIPLAASLLSLSTKFRWNSMALFGLTATYLTCISKGSSGAPLPGTQALFLCYWVLFEGFDFLRIRRRDMRGGIEHLFPLNTIAFLGLSYQVWSHQAPQHLWLAAAMGAVLFLSSAITRAFLRPPSSFGEESSLPGRLREGSFEGAFLVSALLSGMAIAGRIPGVWTSFGLVLEAEIIYLAGLRFRSDFLRETGARAFMVSLASLAAEGYPALRFPVFGHPIWNWTPAAILHASLFYLNRSIRSPNAVFSSASAAIIALVIACEVPLGWVGTILILFGIVLLEIGTRTRGLDLRVQSYGLIVAGGAFSAVLQISGHESGWGPLATSLGATYALSLCRRSINKNFRVLEATVLSFGLAVIIPAMSLLLVWRAVPGDYLALAWSLLALLMFELGNRRMPAELRLTLLPLACAAGLATIGTHSADFVKHGGLSVSATYAGAWLASWVAAARLTLRPATGTEFPTRTGTLNPSALIELAISRMCAELFFRSFRTCVFKASIG